MPDPDGTIQNRDIADDAVNSRTLEDDLTLGGTTTLTGGVTDLRITGELRIPVETSDPVSPTDGTMWLHTGDNALYIWEGGAKRTVASW